MKHSAQLLRFNQLRQGFLRGGFHLAGVFPQLRGDVVQFQCGVHCRFVGTGDGLPFRPHGILVQAPAAFDSPLPQPHVVILTAREVHQRKRELFRRDHSQVGIQRDGVALILMLKHHARFRSAVADDL